MMDGMIFPRISRALESVENIEKAADDVAERLARMKKREALGID
jgi:hypothetical protein